MSPEELDRILNALAETRIAVVGDVCLDVYKFLAESSEISVETGLPTRIVESMRSSLGGAANVAANLASLRVGLVSLYGIIGDDLYGREILEHCRKAGIRTDGIVTQHTDWFSNVYTKLYKDDTEEPRIDLGTLNKASSDSVAGLLRVLAEDVSSFDAVIINQQLVNGIHTPEFREGLARIIQSNPSIPFYLDSRDYLEAFPGTIRKLNQHEAGSVVGGYDDVGALAVALSERWGQTVYLTRGEDGCIVAESGSYTALPAAAVAGSIDPVGAGDSVIAGIVAARAAGADSVQAATFGTYVAGVTVRILKQTGTATPDQVSDIGASPDFVYNPELARSPHQARYHHGGEIEVISGAPQERFRYAIFDHDGTISTAREGWESLMEPMMCRAVLGEYLDAVPSERYAMVREAVREFIDRTTGYQTMYQMQELARMVAEFGYVGHDELKTAVEYKAIYNEELLRMVGRRLESFRAGHLSREDLTLKNSVPFMQRLRNAGLTLFLASGTDQDDVRAEAELLGYADLFNGGIFGSVGDVKRDPKRVVIERILGEIGAENSAAIVTFGDGPVEIRETRKAGGYAVGVASDEVRRYGLNLSKRERLVRAGADCIIPDYAQINELWDFLWRGKE